MTLKSSKIPDATGAMAVFDRWDAALANQFTYDTRFGETVELAEEGPKGKMLLPRAAFPVGVQDTRVQGVPISVQSDVKPRSDEQARVIDESVEMLKDGESFIVEAPTGFGKTVMAADIISKVGRKTLVIVPKEDLMKQWRDALIQFTSLTEKDIGIIRGPKCQIDGKKVVLGMLQSLSKPEKYASSIRTAFGFVIWDEVHRLPADTFQTTAGYFYAKLRLGLSATPQRADGKEETIYGHIGPVAVTTEFMTLKPVVGLYRSPWRVPRWGNGKYMTHVAGKTMHVEKDIAVHDQRNALLMKLIHKSWSKGRKTVVFSSLVKHLRLLEHTSHSLGIPPKDTGLYISETPAKKRDAMQSRPLLFATWGMMAEGTNIPWLDCCILATPRSNVKQAVGRILREYPDKPRPVILDIVDGHSPVFKRYGDRRLDLYLDLGADITRY